MAVKYSKLLHFIISDYTWSFSDHSLLFLDAGVIFSLVSEIAEIPDPARTGWSSSGRQSPHNTTVWGLGQGYEHGGVRAVSRG